MSPARPRVQPVTTFLVERYWPGVTVERFIDAVRRIDEVVARLRREGAAIRTVASTHVPDDEAAYWVVDASAVELVERVFRQAEISVDRIVPALNVRTADEARPARPRSMGPGRPGRGDGDTEGDPSADTMSAIREGGPGR
jgi:hypothetical protein